jgi:hypothetical protein
VRNRAVTAVGSAAEDGGAASDVEERLTAQAEPHGRARMAASASWFFFCFGHGPDHVTCNTHPSICYVHRPIVPAHEHHCMYTAGKHRVTTEGQQTTCPASQMRPYAAVRKSNRNPKIGPLTPPQGPQCPGLRQGDFPAGPRSGCPPKTPPQSRRPSTGIHQAPFT